MEILLTHCGESEYLLHYDTVFVNVDFVIVQLNIYEKIKICLILQKT